MRVSGGGRHRPIFTGSRPMRVCVFASGTGGNLRTVLQLVARRPELLELALVVSDRPGCDAVAIARTYGVETIARDFAAACGRASDARTARERAVYAACARRFHDAIDDELRAFERRTRPLDLIVLAYRRWIHGRLLARFEGRIVNQHPGDLRALDEDGRRVLVGNNPVLAALRLGHPRVRTTTFVVDEGHDAGGIVCQGPWVSTVGHRPIQSDADRLEQVQKRVSDRPALICALTAIGSGTLALDPGRRGPDGSPSLVLDGVPLPFGGIDLAACA